MACKPCYAMRQKYTALNPAALRAAFLLCQGGFAGVQHLGQDLLGAAVVYLAVQRQVADQLCPSAWVRQPVPQGDGRQRQRARLGYAVAVISSPAARGGRVGFPAISSS